ncbi:Protein CBG26495 [Caenorhabditis briggsae]|uniref:Protein CBG26495 n=1 Tax=Caenorhabditis briggsae TaxID=6238 RepID=B6IH46_CAEBR|nr:Protein CBG26495 [Caenorhabditis briggsae]CAR99226.1 Protein CBG26495 [Caenorhabditis briggsae]
MSSAQCWYDKLNDAQKKRFARWVGWLTTNKLNSIDKKMLSEDLETVKEKEEACLALFCEGFEHYLTRPEFRSFSARDCYAYTIQRFEFLSPALLALISEKWTITDDRWTRLIGSQEECDRKLRVISVICEATCKKEIMSCDQWMAYLLQKTEDMMVDFARVCSDKEQLEIVVVEEEKLEDKPITVSVSSQRKRQLDDNVATGSQTKAKQAPASPVRVSAPVSVNAGQSGFISALTLPAQGAAAIAHPQPIHVNAGRPPGFVQGFIPQMPPPTFPLRYPMPWSFGYPSQFFGIPQPVAQNIGYPLPLMPQFLPQFPPQNNFQP